MKALNNAEVNDVSGGFFCLLQLLNIFKPAAPVCPPPKPPVCEPRPPHHGDHSGHDRC